MANVSAYGFPFGHPKPSAKLDADDPKIGSKKPGHDPFKSAQKRDVKRNGESGYRVLPYGTWLNASEGDRDGDVYSTPDMAILNAKKRAKSALVTYLILRDGKIYMIVRKDGSTE